MFVRLFLVDKNISTLNIKISFSFILDSFIRHGLLDFYILNFITYRQTRVVDIVGDMHNIKLLHLEKALAKTNLIVQ